MYNMNVFILFKNFTHRMYNDVLMPQAFSTCLPSGGAETNEKVHYTSGRNSKINMNNFKLSEIFQKKRIKYQWHMINVNTYKHTHIHLYITNIHLHNNI